METKTGIKTTIENPTIQQTTRAHCTVWVVLPVFNEGQAILDLLHEFEKLEPELPQRLQIVVVDDGSDDFALDAMRGLAREGSIKLLENPQNLGLGKTLHRGLRHVLQHAGDNDILVTMDGDNTHPPELVPGMLRRIQEGHDVVVASRYQEGATIEGLQQNRRILSDLGRYCFQWAAPIKGVKDYTCGYRAIRVRTLRKAAEYWGDRFLTETGFTVTAELLLRLKKIPVKCVEVPLILRYQNKTTPSKMKVMRTTLQTLGLLARHCLGRL